LVEAVVGLATLRTLTVVMADELVEHRLDLMPGDDRVPVQDLPADGADERSAKRSLEMRRP
jgi:hypothetical protein